MAEIPESTVIPPPTLEQRMERLEGNFGQILGLLKTLIPDKEIANDNSNNNDNGGGGMSIQTNGENPSKVVIVTESSGPDENVKDTIREGRLNGLTASQDKLRKPGFQKKEGEVHVNNVSFPNNPPFTQNQFDQPRREKVKIDPVPISYSELYDNLLKQYLVAPEFPLLVSNPPLKWYNPAKTCKYHMRTPGHTIEKCWTFKLRVQRLRDAGQLSFKEAEGQSTGASVDKDPLLKH
ncbi:hypothetical protein SESBI_26247 [Sesbania bispinosa]|nr:hypothetical protein SESBI_26247 [Sesbania bispinosa]